MRKTSACIPIFISSLRFVTPPLSFYLGGRRRGVAVGCTRAELVGGRRARDAHAARRRVVKGTGAVGAAGPAAGARPPAAAKCASRLALGLGVAARRARRARRLLGGGRVAADGARAAARSARSCVDADAAGFSGDCALRAKAARRAGAARGLADVDLVLPAGAIEAAPLLASRGHVGARGTRGAAASAPVVAGAARQRRGDRGG